MYGRDFAYAATRLAHSVVRVAKTNEPVFVTGVNPTSGLCVTTSLESVRTGGRANPVEIPLDKLNVVPVRLGYVNISGEAIYLERSPVRHGPGNQGLNVANCMSSGANLFKFPTSALRLCIMGKYPSFKKALAASKVKKRSGAVKVIAFSRHWAIRGGKDLFYKNRAVVGHIEGGLPVLAEGFEYLKEYLGEHL